MKREQEDLLGTGKLAMAIPREKIIAFKTSGKIIHCTKHCLCTVHNFVQLYINNRY
jgi:hypothetical protein